MFSHPLQGIPIPSAIGRVETNQFPSPETSAAPRGFQSSLALSDPGRLLALNGQTRGALSPLHSQALFCSLLDDVLDVLFDKLSSINLRAELLDMSALIPKSVSPRGLCLHVELPGRQHCRRKCMPSAAIEPKPHKPRSVSL